MNIGIIDADLLGRKKHRFPNLACEKISAYHKMAGDDVTLLTQYNDIENFDKVYISKVFTDTPLPINPRKFKNVKYGGTGFFFDKAKDLPRKIEHIMPDYRLYDAWIEQEIMTTKIKYNQDGHVFNENRCRSKFKEFFNYSIGYLTRGCFRKCPFCVNQKYDHVFKHSPLSEFFDKRYSNICMLDDNFLGSPSWRELLEELIATDRKFKFKQGLDERMLTEESCKLLFSARYDGDYTFAFDNPGDYDLIHEKLKLIRKYTGNVNIKFYVLVGFESTDATDIENIFKRVSLLMQYKCLPYIMRYQNKNVAPWKDSKYYGLYVTIARWGNQPSIFKKMSFRQFCVANQALHKTKGTSCSAYNAMVNFEKEFPNVAKKYFDLRYEDYKI